MRAVYQPRGKAFEYAALALNLYNGCQHGCVYCYAASLSRKPRAEFHAEAYPRELEKELERELPMYRGREVLLCFNCDPYTPSEDKYGLTRWTLKAFERHGVIPNVLTKSGGLAARDFDLLAQTRGKYGATLTFTSPGESRGWEPGAADPRDRLDTLGLAHQRGIHTWVSLEPVIDPMESLRLIEMAAPFVDVFKVGRWNYDPRAEKINWTEFARRAVDLLERLDKRFYVKKDLAKFLGKTEGFAG